MVNERRDICTRAAVLLLAALVLIAVAWNRSAEYDEQYTSFVTSGTPRPVWPQAAFPAREVTAVQAGHAGPMTIARDLRRTDVHPPLYFWVVAAWRWFGGDGPFAIRLLSVLFGLGALGAVGMAARRSGIPPAAAMLLMLGCYGFAYTATIARGFALAQMLTLFGLVALLNRRQFVAGALLGAAVATNYLAVFIGMALIAGSGRDRWRVGFGFLPGILVAIWFFLAQRGSRSGQFPPFEVLPALARLARYGAANLTGGLPLYAPEPIRLLVASGLGLGILATLALVIRHPRWLPIGAAVASPIGLLALGLIFNNTPIELRYLSFATPFVALLVAGARPPRSVLGVIFVVQALSIAGLMTRPETMQPARATAQAAGGQGVVLLPRGNDGVGIVGAFAAEARPDTLLLIVAPDETPEHIRCRLAPFRRVVVAELAQDADSRAAVPAMEAALRDPGWREIGRGFNVIAYERVDQRE